MIKFPISKIVLEGCDLSGKTSLYNSIHKGSGFRWNIEDRSTLSMCIYANQYGRDDYYHRKNLALELSNLNNTWCFSILTWTLSTTDIWIAGMSFKMLTL